MRIRTGEIFPSSEKLIGFDIHAVMQNGNTHFGKLESLTKNHLLIRDPRNHPHNLAVTDLYEIVYDAVQLKQ
jgi:hypothetical protein